jgi:hypothetical protein
VGSPGSSSATCWSPEEGDQAGTHHIGLPCLLQAATLGGRKKRRYRQNERGYTGSSAQESLS